MEEFTSMNLLKAASLISHRQFFERGWHVGFWVVIEPITFDMSESKVLLPDFGLVFRTSSETQRNLVYQDLCKSLKTAVSPGIATIFLDVEEFQERLVNTSKIELRAKGVKGFNESIVTLLDIMVETSLTRATSINTECFSDLDDSDREFYWCYFGTQQFTTSEIRKKNNKKLEWLTENRSSKSLIPTFWKEC